MIRETKPSTAATWSRRGALALGAGAALSPVMGQTALGKSLLDKSVLDKSVLDKAAIGGAAQATHVYNLRPVAIADGVWVVMGAADKITAQNGGAIANVVIFDTADGVVVVDTGPSHRYGMELSALTRELTGKPVARVYVTHIHSDHSLGATAFSPDILYGPKGLAEDLKRRGNDITNAMYRVAGDWMRGTDVPDLRHVAADGVEQIGKRRFRCLTLAGHTADDLCLFEETSGLLIGGDLVFLDRAPTTPDADLPTWRNSLATLADVPHAKLVPGHGPIEPGKRGIEQTRRWLDFVDGAISTHFGEGLDVTEIMATSMPDWTNDIAVARYEYQRSAMHLLPKLEVARLPIVS